MFCPNCSQMITDGSRFCMHCGFNLVIGGGLGEKTTVERAEVTVCEVEEDLSEKTKFLSTEAVEQKPKKSVETKKQVKKTGRPLFFAWLVCLEGTDKGKDYRIINEKTTIGKSEDSDIILSGGFASRNHAILFHEQNRFILNDLQSTNHTYVNDRKISRRILKDDDLIKFGDAVYKFKCL